MNASAGGGDEGKDNVDVDHWMKCGIDGNRKKKEKFKKSLETKTGSLGAEKPGNKRLGDRL